MNNKVYSEDLLTHYLLGKLSEGDMLGIEEAYFADDDLHERLQALERDLIDKYVRGELNKKDRERFEQNFLSTPKRQQKLRFASVLHAYISKQKPATRSEYLGNKPRSSTWRKLKLKPAFITALSVILISALGLGIWRGFFYQSELDKGASALKQAYREQRPIQARISDHDYAPFTVTRGKEDSQIDDKNLALAERIFLNEALNNPSADSYHALGRFYLANRDFDKAIKQFQDALLIDRGNAELYSDLGAAYMERAMTAPDKPNLSDLAMSLEQFNQAIEINNSLLAAHFNRALCLQRMNSPMSAKEAWEDYLKRDADSEWSKEARRNLQSLQERVINNKPPEEIFRDFMAAYRQGDKAQAWRIHSQTKEMITGTMIPFQMAQRLLAASSSDQAETGKEILGAFKFAGLLEKEQSGDPFFAELARFYSRAEEKDAITLKQAQEAIRRGYQLCLKGRYGDAAPHFETAQGLFLRAGDIWESKVVDYWRAYCLTYREELNKSSALLEDLAEYCRRNRYYWLEAQAYCWQANNSALLGEYSQGVEQNKKSLRLAAATGDLYLVQKTSSRLAEDYKFLGRHEEAAEFNQRSLPASEAYYISLRQFWRSLNSITDTLFALRLYSAAESFEQEALHLALNHFGDAELHSTYRRLGQIYAGRKDYSAAEQALEASLKALQPIEDDPNCKKLRGLSMLQIGNVKKLMGDYQDALQYYQQAAKAFDSGELALHNYATRKAMLSCYLLSKDDDAIRQELPQVLSLFEQNRQRIKEERNRNHFFDAEQGIYELAIDYEHGRKNKEQSFHYTELSRARCLQDAIIGGAIASNDLSMPDVIVPAVSQPLTLDELQRRLPANLRLVEYAALENRLLAWVVTSTRLEEVELPVSTTTLEAAASEYLRVLKRNDADSIQRERELAAQLHDWLFAPLESYLGEAEEVVLVPDKFLFKVPFAALLSRQSGRRVIQDYTLHYAPSATVFVLCSDQASIKVQDKQMERLLSVGNPVLSRQSYKTLVDMPAAAAEAEKVAPFYRTGTVLTWANASKDRILPELKESDVIHFAVHYLTNDFAPAKSRLMLATGRETQVYETASDLSLQEIQTLRHLKAKAVILSACQSGIERYYAGEGVIGLSRAFLIAGVPLVIASQWAVESDSTAYLMVEFHKLRKLQGHHTVEALRQAQLAMLRHEDERYRRPYYWAAFFSIGGHASY